MCNLRYWGFWFSSRAYQVLTAARVYLGCQEQRSQLFHRCCWLFVVVVRSRALLLLATALASVFPLSDSPHREASGRQALPERSGLRGFLWVWPFILNCQDRLWTRSSKPTRNRLKRHRSAFAAEQHVCWSRTNNNLQVKYKPGRP